MKLRFIFLFFLPTVLFAQEFYISDVQENTNTSRIKTVDKNFNVTDIVEVDQNAGLITDIALAPDGTLFAVSTLDALITIDLTSGAFEYLFPLGAGNFNNLVYDGLNDELIAIDTNNSIIFRINPNDGSTLFSAIDIITPGDLTFYKGSLIFQEFYTLDIYAYDSDSNSTKKVSCFGDVEVFGFSNFINSCGENLIYGFNEFGSVYSFNIEANTYDLVGDIGSDTFTVSGSTTINEYIAATCPVEFLDEKNCELQISENTLVSINIYPNPFIDKLNVVSQDSFDDFTYTVFDLKGEKIIQQKPLSSEIDLSSISSGIYFIEFKSLKSNSYTVKKIIKD